MLEFIFGSVWGWIGATGLVVLACLAVAWLIPPLRPYAIAAAGAMIWAASAYVKGSRDRARLEQARKEEAVRKARADYDKIDARPDSIDDVARRLRKHDF